MKKNRFLWIILVIIILSVSAVYMISDYLGTPRRQKEELYLGETIVLEKNIYDEFQDEVLELIKEYDGEKIDNDAVLSPYYSRRLIVQGKREKLDLTQYGAKKVICGPDNMYIMQFTTQEATKAAENQLSKINELEYCEPDQYMGIFNETKEYQPLSWGVKQIGADSYANTIQKSPYSRVIVAVVDTGIFNHSFLKGRIEPGGKDFVDNDLVPDDGNSHGTHVAGTIVDCTPNVNISILPIKVLGTNGFGSWLRISMGIRYAVDKGAQVINMSLGGNVSKTVDNAVTYAINQGCTVVVAAGNDNQDTANVSPAHLDECIVVSAIDANLQKADFSNWGDSIDVCAPGVNIISCSPKHILGPIFGETKKSMDGTSMATPHVSALAALIKLSNPSKTPKQILEVIKNHCDDLGDDNWDKYYGWGVPNFNRTPKVGIPKDEENTKTNFTNGYEDILLEYKRLAESNFSTELLENAKYVNKGAWNFNGEDQYSIYYRFLDISNDGNPELIISVNEKEAPKNIIDIYGMEGNEPIRIIENNNSVGYRSIYYICVDNRIKNVGSGGALDSIICYYSLPRKGCVMQIEDQYIYNGWNGDQFTHIDSDNISTEISKEEYTYYASGEDVDFESDWELLYKGKSIHYIE